jgi:hypothetical protein
MNRRSTGFLVAAGTILCVLTLLPLASGQNTATNTDMKILLDKIKADKKLVVASNMELTEPEKMAFWPIYDAYQKDLQGINDRLVKTIKEYADAYTGKTLTNDQAKKLTDEVLAIEADEARLRSTYATRLNAALPGKTVARYLQIESKIRAAVRYDMANNIPLVP